MVRLPIFILIWICFILLKAAVVLLGLAVVPVLYRYRHVSFADVPKVFTPWLNPEDWNDGHRGTDKSLPKWWIDEPVSDIGITVFGKDVVFRKAREHRGFGFGSWYHYHAIRNPANGLRNIEWLDLDIDPAKVKYYSPDYRLRYEPVSMRKDGAKTAWYVAWQGWQAGMKYVHVWNDKRHFVMKMGWRIEPKDKTVPIDPAGTRVDDAGFATKLLPYRKG